MKINLLSILIVLGLVAACAEVPFIEPDNAQAAVIKPDIPQTESECLTKGGHWIIIGLSYPGKPKQCDLKATDGGKICTDSSQCQGECMAQDNAIQGSQAKGTCSEYILNFGCAKRVANGQVGIAICAD